jgi:tetraacyldisaccharide 4'-kinase
MSVSHNTLVLSLLGGPALVYGAAVKLRLRLYGLPGFARRVGLPVISVGNLTVGGTGKTTIVAWLVSELMRRGRRPAVVSRGYLGRAGRGPVIVSLGQGPLVEPEVSGDEPFLLATRLPGAVVIAGSDRVVGCEAALKAGADCVVLDDGFQHLRLARDLDIVLLDAHNPFGNYRLLPAGTLREPASGLRRADAVVITRSRPGESFSVVERVVRRHNATVPLLRAGHRWCGFVNAEGEVVERPEQVVAFCGIGNPEAFATDLEHQGVHVTAFRKFRDHHPFTRDDWDELRELASHHRATLLTTEKDLVRLRSLARTAEQPAVVALRIEAAVHDAAPLLALVDAALRRTEVAP